MNATNPTRPQRSALGIVRDLLAYEHAMLETESRSAPTVVHLARIAAFTDVESMIVTELQPPATASMAQPPDAVQPYSLDVKRLARASEGYAGYGWEITCRGADLDAVLAEAFRADRFIRDELDARRAADTAGALAELPGNES